MPNLLTPRLRGRRNTPGQERSRRHWIRFHPRIRRVPGAPTARPRAGTIDRAAIDARAGTPPATDAASPPPPDRAALTRAEVALLIERRFGVRYHSQSIPALLRRWMIMYICAPAPIGGSRTLVARLILDRFGICYSPASIPHLLRSLGISLRAVRRVPNARALSSASGAHQLTAIASISSTAPSPAAPLAVVGLRQGAHRPA